ncbi:MAG: nucleoside phosphorylase [Lachnospiraceae bacterium]|nr:nucleoside phosphorylase [Lachnospiraceae bacterium]
MIRKNEIPILEYDDASLEVISPTHDLEGVKPPEKCLFTFLGDVVDDYAKKNNAEIASELITVSHKIKIYILHEEKEDICLVQSLIGSAAAVSILDSLVSSGCKKVIAVGSCGVLADLPENAFIVPTKALRDEGTSYHYLPASRFIELDKEPISVIEDTFKKYELPFVTCTTWSTDGFFRETKDLVKYRLEEGCSVVEMECSALAACCRKRGAKFGQFLFTADSLANVHEYDARSFGTDSHEKALLLGLDVLRNYN